jgi:1-acyl-sn-glycerol-3-phosphate acyltransferase
MIRTLVVFSVVPVYMVLGSLVGYPLALLSGSPAPLYGLGRFGIRLALFLAGSKVVVDGLQHLDETANTVVMANHTSLLDAPILANLIKAEFKVVAKVELFRIPFFGRCLRLAGFISVDRSNREQATQAIQKAVVSLKAGNCFLIFPEGTRSPTGALGPFKKGAFHVALDAQSRIVPVAVSGARELMPKGAFRVRPGTVTVQILDPIEAGRYSYDSRDRLIEDVRGRIAAALETPKGPQASDRPAVLRP